MQQTWSEIPAGASVEDDLALCRKLIQDGSKTFYASSKLLPASVRDPAYALYAFCRVADDEVDLGGGQMRAVARLRDRLERLYQGRPLPIPADRAFAEVVQHYAIPKAVPEALIEGLEWDALGRRYQTLAELYDYSARVASTVGVMMSLLMGIRDADALARACDLGLAMQLTNIARDVGEDARNGRIYLPLDWMAEAGIDAEAWLANPGFNPQIASVIRRLLEAADVLYRRSAAGISRLPLSCRPAIHAARIIYAEIGREVEKAGFDSVSRRAVVPFSRKLTLLSQAVAVTPLPSPSPSAPAEPEVQFLIEAVRATESWARVPVSAMPWWRVGERTVRLFEVMADLERRQMLAARVNAGLELSDVSAE